MAEEFDDIFERLYNTYFDRLMFYALRFVNEQSEAEDIISDVFFQLWQRHDEIDFSKGIATYLYRAVATHALSYLRHRKVSAIRLELLESVSDRRIDFIDHDSIVDTMEQDDRASGLRRAINELPEKSRQAFTLSYINHLRSKDIAEVMGISQRTVETHIYKALKILREKLKYLMYLIIVLTFFPDWCK